MRTWVADLGNSTLFLGVFAGGRRVASFRAPAETALAKGGIARAVAPRLRGPFDAAALCSVVPAHTGRLVRALTQATGCTPALLTTRSSGLRIAYRRPAELGHDRLACALGAQALFPRRNLLVVDCGTATTVTAVSRDGTVQGGAILPGLGLWAEMLAVRTAQLPEVSLGQRVPAALGRSTRDALRSGIVLGHLGALRELTQRIAHEAFGRSAGVLTVGTGGHAEHFAREKLFTVVEPELILTGLRAFAEARARHD